MTVVAKHRTSLVRLTWAALALIPTSVLALAATLEPDAAGHGTHTQLGLPACGFLVVTGIRCPGCGLTTTFAHMMRLEVYDAFRANPFGVLLFLSVLGFTAVAAWASVRAAPLFDTLERFRADRLALGLSVAALLNWIIVLWQDVWG